MKAPRKQIPLRIPLPLLDRIDAQITWESRNAWILKVLQAHLDTIERKK